MAGNRKGQPETDIPIQALEQEKIKNAAKLSNQQNDFGLFSVKPANDWIEEAKSRPIPKMLFDCFWHEGEICILFADTNLGKSILAVQIGDAITKGKAIDNFRLEAEKQPVLYFDFELSDKQFEARYSKEYKNHYEFSNDFFRTEINSDSEIPENTDFETWLNISLERTITQKNIKILIIDNLTYLKTETEKARNALPLMKHLKKLKSKYNLSLLILAHTPKRDLSKPINRNDLQGSKMLINFCDSCFSIGESHQQNGVRYLKQIKARNTEVIYDGDNVAVFRIEKPDNFLMFTYMGYGTEREHLRSISQSERDELENKILELKENEPDLSYRKIAEKLGTNAMKVKRTLDRNEQKV